MFFIYFGYKQFTCSCLEFYEISTIDSWLHGSIFYESLTRNQGRDQAVGHYIGSGLLASFKDISSLGTLSHLLYNSWKKKKPELLKQKSFARNTDWFSSHEQVAVLFSWCTYFLRPQLFESNCQTLWLISPKSISMYRLWTKLFCCIATILLSYQEM